MSQKLEAQGGKAGNEWDDGTYDGVKKVDVAVGRTGVTYVQFDYVSNGQVVSGPVNGLNDNFFARTFEINHPEEYLVSIEGYYDETGIIQALQFKTNQNTSPLFGYEEGTKFTLEVEGSKVAGFHGYADTTLNGLGAYFVPSISSTPSLPPVKLEAHGGEGDVFDDGAFDGVRKVYVGQGEYGVAYVKFDYDNNGELVTREHGKRTMLGEEEYELEFPDEYIVTVMGTYDKIYGKPSEVITALIFKTSKGRTSPPFGIFAGTEFVLENNGGQLVGFHGRGTVDIHALGAYFTTLSTPLTPAKPFKKLEAQGGDAGTEWDDNTYEGVRKVYVGQGEIGVSFVKFEYFNGTEVVVGGDHGKKSLLGTEEFELEYPSEYITAVEGTYDKIYGGEAEVITMLRFKTNKQTSAPFGIEAGTTFVFEEKDHKIVGFHGKAGDVIHQFGVHVAPINK